MKISFEVFFLRAIIFCFSSNFLSHGLYGKTGFSLPDSMQEFSLRYNTVDNLIILPVRINDSVQVNLILDTGCRNILLFGKRFQKLFKLDSNRIIEFSGMGNGGNVRGNLALSNHVSIGMVEGENVPIVVIPERKVFKAYAQVDGLIGYDIFTKFEVEIHPHRRMITFRSAFTNYVPDGYSKIPMMVVDSKPVFASHITFPNETIESTLLIDTGSTLGLLLKSSDETRLDSYDNNGLLGKGLNGLIRGGTTVAEKIMLDDFELTDITAGIIHSPWYNYASIGMNVLKNYSIILNYAKSYVCLRKNS
ncbi:MAG TPA: retropepsin-like aspartic protease [Cyclobacteriaceae bacterium]|nr:retropepsin-like aspartic protease [Cyclobacteriaceae bacterium]